jgi:hypothetical protein
MRMSVIPYLVLTVCVAAAVSLAVVVSRSAVTVHGSDDGGGGPPASQPASPVSGSYQLKIAGDYTGLGSATVAGGSVSITGSVKDNSGNIGSFQATMQLGNNHVTGTGTVMAQSFNISGHIDPLDQGSKAVIHTQRISCTFMCADGTVGRVMGFMVPPSSSSGGGSGGTGSGGTGSSGSSGTGAGGTGGTGGGGGGGDGPHDH